MAGAGAAGAGSATGAALGFTQLWQTMSPPCVADAASPNLSNVCAVTCPPRMMMNFSFIFWYLIVNNKFFSLLPVLQPNSLLLLRPEKVYLSN